jgi:hypothetical protein
MDQPPLDPATRAWLMAGDPAIRWQVMRDLDEAPTTEVDLERGLVAVTGWGARLLALQDPEGTWAGQMYSPKWTSTTYTMLLLRELGLPAETHGARLACAVLLDRGVFEDGGISFGWGRSETCVTSIVLSILAAFRFEDERVERLVDRLLAEQMADGGWNCRRPRGATHASMHTTILALEAMLLYEGHRATVTGRLEQVREAQARGREFLLVHRLFRSHRGDSTIRAEFTRMAFPPQWHFDFLRALDHFRTAGAPRDERLSDAIDLLVRKRRPDGRWRLEHRHRARDWFQMETVGAPSRWNTLRALRVLGWWAKSGA